MAWVTIDREEARNALNAAVRDGLWAATRRFNDDPKAKVLVLTGAGERAFCAGADLREMADGAMEVPPPDFLPIFGRNIEVTKPTIAAVNGVAYAGGFLLTQMCDLVRRGRARAASRSPRRGSDGGHRGRLPSPGCSRRASPSSCSSPASTSAPNGRARSAW